jgi:hypothetical protein
MPVCTTTLTPLRADDCTTGVIFGRIDRIYLTKVGDGLTDWSSSVEWTGRIDNATAQPTNGDPYHIRQLNVIGSVAEPEQNEISISANRFAYSLPEFTVEFSIDDTASTDNYAFMQTLIANNGGIYALWLEGGGYLYGGNDGVEATIKLSYEVPEDNNDIVRMRGTAKWKGAFPARIATPF